MNWVIFNGESSESHNLIVTEKSDVFTLAQRDNSFLGVPGRDGEVITDNGRYKNIPQKYTFQLLTTDFENQSKNIRKWLNPAIGYAVLRDSYDPGYFRLGAVQSVSIAQEKDFIGKVSLALSCKPHRYSLAGAETITLTASGSVTNPEPETSLPHIKITGSGNVTLHVNSNSYLLSTISPNIEIDSEMMSVYRGTTLLNNKAGFDEFPVFEPGENSISWTGTVTKVEIVPRWRCL